MKYRLFFSIATASVLGTAAFAGTMGAAQDWRWVGSIAAGPVWSQAGATQAFYLAPEIEKAFVADKARHGLISGELFAGIQKHLQPQLQGQLGLALAMSSNTALQGVIWDDAEPQFDNYRYHYKVQHTHAALKGKLLVDRGWALMPWVSASAGVGFNDAHDYTNTPLIFEALPNSNFSNHTETAFTYTLGVGVQKPLTEHMQVGIGYEFADWGKSRLGTASGQTLNTGLSLNHLYTNGVMLNLTYLA